MAIYNEILAGRFSRSLQKLFSMKGSNPAKQISGEIMPVHPFFSGAENRVLESWNRYGTTTNAQAAVAASAFHFQINNPPGSGIVAVFEKITCASSTAFDAIVISSAPNNPAQLATLLPGFATNTRWDPRGAPNSALLFSQTEVAPVDLGTPRFFSYIPVNTPIDVINTDIDEFSLLPGDALRIRQGVVNQTYVISLFWRERALEESELGRG